jgi:hypothetical protein
VLFYESAEVKPKSKIGFGGTAPSVHANVSAPSVHASVSVPQASPQAHAGVHASGQVHANIQGSSSPAVPQIHAGGSVSVSIYFTQVKNLFDKDRLLSKFRLLLLGLLFTLAEYLALSQKLVRAILALRLGYLYITLRRRQRNRKRR